MSHQCDRCVTVHGDGPLQDETWLCNSCLQIALEEAEAEALSCTPNTCPECERPFVVQCGNCGYSDG